MEIQEVSHPIPTSNQISTTNQGYTGLTLILPNKQKKLFTIFLLVIILTILVLTGFLSFMYNQKTLSIREQYSQNSNTSNLTTNNKSVEAVMATDLENQDNSRVVQVSHNTNNLVNPILVAGLLNWTRGSFVFSYEPNDESSLEVYTSIDGKYSFEHPSDVSIYELPSQFINNAFLITSNDDDISYIEDLKVCLKNQAIFQTSICDISLGEYFVFSIEQPHDRFFLTEYNTKHAEIRTTEIEDNRVVSLLNESALIEELFRSSSLIESSITLSVYDRPIFDYRIKLNESNYTEKLFLRFVGYAYPTTYPYKQALSTILNTFKTN